MCVYCTRISMCVYVPGSLLQGSQKSLAKPSMHERRSIEKADAAVFCRIVMFADDLIHSNECLIWVC
jgi:hypothetical protein